MTSYIAGHLRDGGHPPEGVRDNPDVRVHQDRIGRTYEAYVALPDASPEESAAVTQVLSLLGHAIDNGDSPLLDEVFTDDAPRPAVATGDHPLPSHHTLNTQVRRRDDELVAWSRLVTIAGNGSVASADAIDVLVSTDAGWRVSSRVVHPRHGGPATVVDGTEPW